MLLILIIAFAAACLTSLVLTAIVRTAAARIGFVDRPSGRKQHEEPVPYGGGIAVCLATCAVVLGAALLAHLSASRPSGVPVPQGLDVDVRLAAQRLPLLLWVVGGGIAMALLGLVDDIRPVGPKLKLLSQSAIAIAVVAISGIRVTAFIPSQFVQAALTVVWIVLLTNSFNLLDNMDGLSGTVAFICAGVLVILALQTAQFFIAGFLVALMGGILGFLVFNFPPARIFMGDTGAMFVGYMLAAATVLASFLNERAANPLFPVLVPAIIFAVPLYDTLSVLAIRLRQGRPILVGDRSHFSHRLQRLGKSPRRVLLTIGLMTLATALGATVPYGSSDWCVLAPAVQGAAIVLVIIELELAGVGKE